MRNLVLGLALLGAVLTVGACADSPTQADGRRTPDLATPALDGQMAPQGCVLEGTCILPPITVDGGCDPWMELDWSCEDGGGSECMTSVGSPTDPELGITVQSCLPGGEPGGGGGTPLPGEEENSDICPQPILGKVATALVNVAGRNHEFKFEGPLNRVNPLVGRSPAWYRIAGPTLSKDSWWMAESGNLLLVCWGRYVVIAGVRTWIGQMYVQNTELHMVMGPGHPDF